MDAHPSSFSAGRPFALLAGALLLMVLPAPAEADPRERLAAYFATEDAGARQELAAAIAKDPAYRAEKLSELLHAAPLFPAREPGRAELEVEVGFSHVRHLTLRLPKGYRPDKKWPLILCYHSSGSVGPGMIRHTEQLLGAEVEKYVLAAPTNYRQTSLDAPPPFTPEHVVMLREIKKTVNVDSDRVFAVGYSLGGYMSWTLAYLYPELFAGVVPMASTISIPGDLAGGWEQITRNFAHLPILHVWGSADSLNVPGLEGRDQFAGTMASFNEQFSPQVKKLGLATVKENRIEGAGHGGSRPDPEDFRQLLRNVRVRWPTKVQHQFRHIHQGSAYWLEAHEWQGEGWTDFGREIERQKGESWPQAFGRTYLPQLAELQGEVLGQKIKVATKHVADFTVWLSPELIELGQPIEIELAGKQVFSGKVAPSLAVALSQAARTRDFERLRWAGVRIDAAGNARVVDAATVFPPLIRTP